MVGSTKKQADGSIDVEFATEAPEDPETSWIRIPEVWF